MQIKLNQKQMPTCCLPKSGFESSASNFAVCAKYYLKDSSIWRHANWLDQFITTNRPISTIINWRKLKHKLAFDYGIIVEPKGFAGDGNFDNHVCAIGW